MIAAFRVDSSNIIGAGHVSRCLSLARVLRGRQVDCIFVCRDHEGNLVKAVRDDGFPVMMLASEAAAVKAEPVFDSWIGAGWHKDAEETIEALGGYPVDWLIVDHYSLDERWERKLRAICSNLLVIDDICNRRHDCDLLLDQNLPDKADRYRALVSPGCGIMSGPAYALVDRAYTDLRPKVMERRGAVRHILVYFGGGRYAGLIRQALEAILELGPFIEVEVVVGQSDTWSDTHEFPPNVRFHSRLSSLAPLMARADLAIGASGTSTWERCCVGLPSVVVTVAGNQEPTAEELASLGIVVHLGNADDVTKADMVNTLRPLLTAGLDEAWSARCLKLVDGRGTDRVVDYMLLNASTSLRLRRADRGDEAVLLLWANDPLARQASLNTRRITHHEHHEWFHRRLANPAECTIFIAETESGLPVGQVRFERREAHWQISFNLNPLCRRRRIATRTVRMAVHAFWEEHPTALLSGVVKVDNQASRAIFNRMEFAESAAFDGIVTFSKLKP